MGLLKSITKGVFGSNKPQEPEKPETEKPKQPENQPEQPQQQQPVEQPQQQKEVNGEDLLPDAQTADTDEDGVTPTVNASQIDTSSQLSSNAAATTASKFLGSAKHRPENLKEKSSNIVTKIKRGI